MPILALWPGFKMNLTKFCTRMACEVLTPPSRRYRAQTLDGRTAEAVLAGRLYWTWMSTAIADILLRAQTEVRLITPYFVPGRAGIAGLTGLAERGVRVCLLTNALSATDMLLVYGAYRRYRGALLGAGAVIHEFSPIPKKGRKRDVLHSKVFVIDGRQAIVGSLNFDLRSAFTNTELGLLFEHPALVADITGMIDTLSAPDQAYAVSRPNMHCTGPWRARPASSDVGRARGEQAAAGDFLAGRSVAYSGLSVTFSLIRPTPRIRSSSQWTDAACGGSAASSELPLRHRPPL